MNKLIVFLSFILALSTNQVKAEDQKYLIIAGKGHLMHYCGVPERIY
jgi:uncharacterized iron-regulated protein